MVYQTKIPPIDNVLSSNVSITNDSSINNVIAESINATIKKSRSYTSNETGWISGILMEQVASGVKIGSGVLRFQDYNQGKEELTFINFDSTIINAVNEFDYISIDKNGQLIISNEPVTEAREVVFIGYVRWNTATEAIHISNMVSLDPDSYERAFIDKPIGVNPEQLIVYGENPNTLGLTGGHLLHKGCNIKVNRNSPNKTQFITTKVPLPFYISYKSVPFYHLYKTLQTTYPIGIYDNNTGNGNTLPDGVVATNSWVVSRLYLGATGEDAALQLGTTQFLTSSEAIEAAKNKTDAYRTNPNFATMRMHAYLAVRGGATNLFIESDCVVVASPNTQIYE